MARARPDEIYVGGHWICHVRVHRGQCVKVLALKTRTVRLQPVGAWSRSQRNNVWTVPLPRFLAAYRPVERS